MEDMQIIQLYFDRSEEAIVETDRKYGQYCYSISYNIVTCREDARECVSDTYLAAWRAIPPQWPKVLGAFLGKITRNISMDCWRKNHRQKRGGGEVVLALEELGDCVADSQSVEPQMERKQLARFFNRFLTELPETERQVFLCRYWYLDSVATIAGYFGFTESKVTSMLHRTRKKLRMALEKEGLL